MAVGKSPLADRRDGLAVERIVLAPVNCWMLFGPSGNCGMVDYIRAR